MLAQQITSKQRKQVHRILTRVARSGEITELAKRLRVTQPAVSAWLRRGFGLSPAKVEVIMQRAAELSMTASRQNVTTASLGNSPSDARQQP